MMSFVIKPKSALEVNIFGVKVDDIAKFYRLKLEFTCGIVREALCTNSLQ